jgi:DNA polymerase-3 subunit alpha
MQALALTDHGAMYGAIEFYKECKKHDIKPIIGVEAYIAERSRFDKDAGIDAKRYHLTLLARNLTGYRNLMRLVTKANLEGYYYKPRMDHDLLREYGEGIICLSGCPGSRFVNYVRNNQIEDAKVLLSFYCEAFGRDYVFVEVMKHDEVEWYTALIPKIIAIAKEMDLPLVGTWDSHYLHKDDQDAHETLVAINTGSDVGGNKMSMKEGNYSLIGIDEAYDAFKDVPGAAENTMKVAELVNLELELGSWVFPNYEIPEGTTYDGELKRLTYEGLTTRNIEKTPEIIERVEYELEVIKNKGYSPYFLVVSDLLRFARESKIVSTTRGSAGGSMVSYLNYITTVNPIEFNLPFERFLNPYRPSAPDIDMDIADNRRDEMIEYARQKYGHDRVAQIGTFGTMMARGAVRDVARALGYPYGIGDRISKLIPMGSQGFPMTIDHAMELIPELKEAYEKERETKEIIDLAKKMEGCARHISVHAAGVVISPAPIDEYTPVQMDPKGGKIITQYDMYTVEEAGLLKFDFLGIRNLAILGDAIDRIEKIRGIKIDLDNLPQNDALTFKMLARGDTIGVFQLSGDGMTKALKDLKPTCVDDINVMVALYRPGPMATIEEYIARKHGKKSTLYYHPKMQKFLEKSFGLLVYQDDLLYTAIELAGYNWESVDKFRKAVGKKIPAEMAKQHEIFVEGCQKHSNMTKKEAERIWDLFEPFQGYGFNKAHAASYGKVAYQTAYLKANFPAEYMSAVLTAEAGDTDKISEVIRECTRMGFMVLPPDINESFSDFTVVLDEKGTVTDRIRFGLRSIKNFGDEIGKAIITERKHNGKFPTLTNFLERVRHKNLNKKSLEALIKSGAMDSFGERGMMLANMETMLSFNKEVTKDGGDDQSSLFGSSVSFSVLTLTPAPPIDQKEKLRWEKELLGLYVSGHPLDVWQEKINALKDSTKSVKENGKDQKEVILAGIIEDIRVITTKKEERMAFLKLTDLKGTIEAVVFPSKLRGFAGILVQDKTILIQGKISLRNGEKSIIIEKAKELL